MKQNSTKGKNDGFKNEDIIKRYINEHSFNECNDNIKNFLNFLFGSSLNPEEKFFASKPSGQVKPDLEIKHNNAVKYVSIKLGSGNSVHQEEIDVFFPFIKTLFGDEILDYLKLFHYGDDTTDGSGVERFSAVQCKKRYPNQIQELNNNFNIWSFLNIFLDRFLFVGNIEDSPIVDCIYYGTFEEGLWASRDEIKNYFQNSDFSSTNLHFGALTYQVWGRNNNFQAVHSKRRYTMQIKWGTIENNLRRIMEDR